MGAENAQALGLPQLADDSSDQQDNGAGDEPYLRPRHHVTAGPLMFRAASSLLNSAFGPAAGTHHLSADEPV